MDEFSLQPEDEKSYEKFLAKITTSKVPMEFIDAYNKVKPPKTKIELRTPIRDQIDISIKDHQNSNEEVLRRLLRANLATYPEEEYAVRYCLAMASTKKWKLIDEKSKLDPTLKNHAEELKNSSQGLFKLMTETQKSYGIFLNTKKIEGLVEQYLSKQSTIGSIILLAR